MDLYAFGFGACATLALELVGIVAYAYSAERARQKQIKQLAQVILAQQQTAAKGLTVVRGTDGVH